ncbi:beta-2-microglobulin-like isoform 1-T2 [Aulostomus maculatus]
MFVCFLLLGLLSLTDSSDVSGSPPMVQVYSRLPGEFGKPNTLICHVSGFHPPEIRIQLLKDGQELADSRQTDLAFEENWQYHVTKHVAFTPWKGEHFSCRVTHMGKPSSISWEPDM